MCSCKSKETSFLVRFFRDEYLNMKWMKKEKEKQTSSTHLNILNFCSGALILSLLYLPID